MGRKTFAHLQLLGLLKAISDFQPLTLLQFFHVCAAVPEAQIRAPQTSLCSEIMRLERKDLFHLFNIEKKKTSLSPAVQQILLMSLARRKRDF